MVPFASPAPLMVPARSNVPLETRRRAPPQKQKRTKKTKQNAAHVEDEVIAPVPSRAQTGAKHFYDDDDDDDMSFEELDKDVVPHPKYGSSSSAAQQQSVSTGVQKMEQVTRSWTPTAVLVAWTGMMLLAIALSLDSLTVSSYQPYALSEFQSHSMLPAISTLQSIL